MQAGWWKEPWSFTTNTKTRKITFLKQGQIVTEVFSSSFLYKTFPPSGGNPLLPHSCKVNYAFFMAWYEAQKSGTVTTNKLSLEFHKKWRSNSKSIPTTERGTCKWKNQVTNTRSSIMTTHRERLPLLPLQRENSPIRWFNWHIVGEQAIFIILINFSGGKFSTQWKPKPTSLQQITSVVMTKTIHTHTQRTFHSPL